MVCVDEFVPRPLSMVSRDGLQRVDIDYRCGGPAHLLLDVYRDAAPVIRNHPVAFSGGRGTAVVMLPQQGETFDAVWSLKDREGNQVAQSCTPWVAARKRRMYVMLSSHTDIGLHNSQYIQRANSLRFLDMAKKLCDETACRNEEDQYRYTMEGTWFWNNYGMDRGHGAAREVVEDYLKTGKLGVCCGIAGNHFQTFGLEEMCRSTYERKRLREEWDLSCETLAMIDNNGLPMSMIQPYAEAGVKNIIFAPNHWNPLPSGVWRMDLSKDGIYLNPDAGGGGSRVDVRYESQLPMAFFWEDESGNRILVWASTQYGYGASAFGMDPWMKCVPETVPKMEMCMAKQLPLLDAKYPYDIWLMCCYTDDQDPDMEVTNAIRAWNEKWEWPRLRTLGNPDEPFRVLREEYGSQIPVLRGDITGGWYQHPVSAPELLARKSEADRLLSTAEKWSVVAGILDEHYGYPATEFRRAWDHLLFHDEHSYGTSGYQGRRVYETWMQHRDWIDKAYATAEGENAAALAAIAGRIRAEEDGLAVFNPTGQARRELVETGDGACAVLDVPAFGYRVVKNSELHPSPKKIEKPTAPPVVENQYYRVVFGENGAMVSIFDKEQGRELLDTENRFRANEMVYTKDNHRTFLVPGKAEFEIIRQAEKTTVVVRTEAPELGAEMVQYISLPGHEKRIDIDNRMYHVRDMINKRRYHRYIYFAFPFAVEKARRYCHLNGAVAEYAVDVTGHGTDVYMAVNEWCCAENAGEGVALMMLDSQLMEFDHIHPDKTDFANAGEGSRMFAYVANDWLQMHTPGGSHLDYRFRFSVTSYQGGYRNAGIPRMAERYANPVQAVPLKKQPGTLDAGSHSFLEVRGGQRLVALKRADDGSGIIARVYGEGHQADFKTGFGRELTAQRVGIDESPLEADAGFGWGFATYRLGGGTLALQERLPVPVRGEAGAPAPIGSVYTGLITEPRAAAGEKPGHLYLLWGRSVEEDLSHYALYRSEVSGFTPDEATFVAAVPQEEDYVVGRYVDTGLKEHTCYYYRVRAVNKAGRPGPLSREFHGFTRESL